MIANNSIQQHIVCLSLSLADRRCFSVFCLCLFIVCCVSVFSLFPCLLCRRLPYVMCVFPLVVPPLPLLFPMSCSFPLALVCWFLLFPSVLVRLVIDAAGVFSHVCMSHCSYICACVFGHMRCRCMCMYVFVCMCTWMSMSMYVSISMAKALLPCHS